MKTKTLLILAALSSVTALSVSGQQERPVLAEDDYDQWERLGGAVLSPNGAWLAVSIGRVSDEGELRIHSTNSDSTIIVPFGSSAAFSSDNRWIAYTVGVSPDRREAAQKSDQPMKPA